MRTLSLTVAIISLFIVSVSTAEPVGGCTPEQLRESRNEKRRLKEALQTLQNQVSLSDGHVDTDHAEKLSAAQTAFDNKKEAHRQLRRECRAAADANAENCENLTQDANNSCHRNLRKNASDFVSAYEGGGMNKSSNAAALQLGELKGKAAEVKGECKRKGDSASEVCGNAKSYVSRLREVEPEDYDPPLQKIREQETVQSRIVNEILPRMQTDIDQLGSLQQQAVSASAATSDYSGLYSMGQGPETAAWPDPGQMEQDHGGLDGAARGREQTGLVADPGRGGLSPAPSAAASPQAAPPQQQAPPPQQQQAFTPSPMSMPSQSTDDQASAASEEIAKKTLKESPEDVANSNPPEDKNQASPAPAPSENVARTSAAPIEEVAQPESVVESTVTMKGKTPAQTQLLNKNALDPNASLSMVNGAEGPAGSEASSGRARAGGAKGGSFYEGASKGGTRSGRSSGSSAWGGNESASSSSRPANFDERQVAGSSNKVGVDLRQFLPGAGGRRGPASLSGLGIHGPHVNMFNKINERYHSLENSLDP